jgi:hypothetical protein
LKWCWNAEFGHTTGTRSGRERAHTLDHRTARAFDLEYVYGRFALLEPVVFQL